MGRFLSLEVCKTKKKKERIITEAWILYIVNTILLSWKILGMFEKIVYLKDI